MSSAKRKRSNSSNQEVVEYHVYHFLRSKSATSEIKIEKIWGFKRHPCLTPLEQAKNWNMCTPQRTQDSTVEYIHFDIVFSFDDVRNF